ncbi:ABC transporter substrate-binding protein [Candidatus Parcubacteria bacterium]|nr:ABC transporter substrate-binding protein [Candidatus Parcubacteria bacterium]
MKTIKRIGVGVLAAFISFATIFAPQAEAAAKHRVCWSRYVGWEPWGYMDSAGILKKWAKKYSIEIELVYVDDYVESINQYTGKTFVGCAMTNMDALNIPASSGVDSTALIVGDFSNGNDGLVLRNGKGVADIKGRRVYIVEGSVSQYMLARALEMNGIKQRDTNVTLVNTGDSQIESVFLNDSSPMAAVVTWNPMLMRVRNAKGVTLAFDSSQIPGEIIDMMVVHTKAPDALKKALTGAWYETMQVMSAPGKPAEDAIAFMANASKATVGEFRAQLGTTRMFYDSNEAAAFTSGPDLKKTMELVRRFSFGAGLMGKVKSADHVGISFPDGTTLGNPKRVKLRFDATFMKLAAEGKL